MGESRTRTWRCAAFLAACSACGAAAHEGESYVLGVLPYQVPARVAQAFVPVAEDLGRALGRHVHLESGTSLPTYIERLRAGEYDIALIDPVTAVELIDSGRYAPVARRPSRPASVVVRPGSPIRATSDLRGEVLGLIAASSPVDLFVLATLEQHGLRLGREYEAKRMPPGACLHRLLVAEIAACATGGGASLSVFEREMGVRLRRVVETLPFPHMVFATHARVPTADREAVRDTVLGWPDTEHGRALLGGIGPDAKFIPYADADYDVVRDAMAASRRRDAALP